MNNQFRGAPYYNTFEEQNKFLSTLFRPNQGVQTRELNELQSILQNQIATVGQFLFQNGQRVVNGETDILSSVNIVTIDNVFNVDVGANIVAQNGLKAKVISSVVQDNKTHVFVSYVNSANDTTTSTYKQNDALTITFVNSDDANITLNKVVSSVNVGAIATIKDGIYFINGYFVIVNAQSIILSITQPLTDTGSIDIGLYLENQIVTSNIDANLLDPVIGSSRGAPGAHRFKIEAKFTTREKVVAENLDLNNFLKIVSIKAGEVVTEARSNEYTVFEDILAQRTFDESGDYIVDDFKLDVREHLKDNNLGLYTAAEGGSESKVGIVLDPGRAYVRGYQIVTNGNTYLETNKARETRFVDELVLDVTYNSYLVVENLNKIPVPGAVCDLFVGPGGPLQGTSKIKAVSLISGGPNRFKVELYDINVFGNSALVTFMATNDSSVGDVIEFVGENAKSVFELPFGFTKAVTDIDADITLQYNSTASANSVTISDPNVQFTTRVEDYIVSHSGGILVPTNISRNNINTSATLTFGSSVSGTVVVSANVRKNNLIVKTKNTIVRTQTFTNLNAVQAGFLILDRSDAYEIISVNRVLSPTNKLDVTSDYYLNTGQTNNSYRNSLVIVKQGIATTAGTYEVVYKFFNHSGGDVFTADSYVDVDYAKIPFYNDGTKNVFLGSCIDFRGVNAPTSVKSLTTSFDHYVPRKDKIVLNKYGKFSVISGTPNINPVAPTDIADSITLYEITIPPYTTNLEDISVVKIPHKRYTMSDIGKIQDRVETLEYVTSLSLLEADANQRDLFDKFKCGFAVDNFKAQTIADYNNPDHLIGYDLQLGNIRPVTTATAINLEVFGSNNIVNKNGLLLLDYTETVGIEQNLASRLERLQPYILYNWNGNVTLNPPTDYWVTYEFKPDLILDGGTIAVSTVEDSPSLAFDTTWNWWGGRRIRENQNLGTLTQFSGTNVEFQGVPFIRSRAITFTGNSFKPNTKLKAFFDNVDVTAFCTPSPLVTSGSGAISGVFTIPNTEALRFKTGDRKFVLSDLNISPDESATYAETKYQAFGTNVSMQKVFVQTRVIADSWWLRRRDPLAQSFAFDDKSGVFVTSIDLYFGVDDALQSSTLVELRTMVNGYPSSNVLARKVLFPGDVTGSSDASVATRFTFDAPVYLEGGVEYCFVAISESETVAIWTSVLGERSVRPGDTTLNTGEVIGKQAFLGSMFKSQNTTTWTAEQTQDIKFKINIAEFVSNGSVNLLDKTHPSDVGLEGDIYFKQLKDNPLLFTANSNVVKVIMENHGFRNGDNVKFTYTGPNGSLPIPNSQINVTNGFVVFDSTVNQFSITVSSNSSIDAKAGGNFARVNNFVDFTAAHLKTDVITFNGTNIDFSLRVVDKISNADTQFSILENSTIEFDSTKIVKNSAGGSGVGPGDMALSAYFKTDNKYISPVLDLEKTGIIGIKNRISAADPVTGPLNTQGYVQKTINLINPANEITVYFDAIKPPGSQIYVYYRTSNGDILSDWVLMDLNLSSSEDFVEYKYTKQLNEFKSSQIKIVLTSNNICKVPIIKNLRTIMLNG